jgi:uncharacterized membrane-anchored protein
MTTETVTKADLEAKLREIDAAVEETTQKWSMWLIAGLAVTAAVVIGVGIMRARRNEPVTVEVYHNA